MSKISKEAKKEETVKRLEELTKHLICDRIYIKIF